MIYLFIWSYAFALFFSSHIYIDIFMGVEHKSTIYIKYYYLKFLLFVLRLWFSSWVSFVVYTLYTYLLFQLKVKQEIYSFLLSYLLSCFVFMFLLIFCWFFVLLSSSVGVTSSLLVTQYHSTSIHLPK